MRILSSVRKIVQRGELRDARNVWLKPAWTVQIHSVSIWFSFFGLVILAVFCRSELLVTWSSVEGVKSSSGDAKLAGTDGEAVWGGLPGIWGTKDGQTPAAPEITEFVACLEPCEGHVGAGRCSTWIHKSCAGLAGRPFVRSCLANVSNVFLGLIPLLWFSYQWWTPNSWIRCDWTASHSISMWHVPRFCCSKL